MRKVQKKLAGIIIAIIMITFVMPLHVLATNEGLQIVKTDNEDYIIYVKDLQKTSFEFAVAQSPDTKELDINYIKSLEDDGGNQVVFVSKEKYEEISQKDNYLFIRKNGEVIVKGERLDFAEAFSKDQIQRVESTTKRIETELVTDIIEKDEEVNGVKIKITVGGLKIVAKENAKYFYAITKLPTEQYDTLKQLADKINKDYEEIDMYSKIELTKQFSDIYEKLAEKQEWQEVENLTIMQPNDAQKGEQYIVYLKEIDENQNEIIDMKLMTSYREDEEEKIPGRTETKVVKETSKLPITGDSIILFVILGVILFVAILVFIRMKKLQNEKK